MRKIILAAASLAFAVGLSACSESTEDAADATVDNAMADAEANMDEAGDAVEGAVAGAESAADEAGDAVEAGAAGVEAEVQDESVGEAAAD